MSARIRPRSVLAFLLLLASVSSGAAELVPYLRNGHIGVVARGTPLPPTLAKDLTSGLTSRILIRLSMLTAGSADAPPLAQRAVEVAIRYDLWEESFIATVYVDGAAVQTGDYASTDAIMSFLAELRLPVLFPAATLGARQLQVRAEVLVNPIERERMEAIRKWVAQNSMPATVDATGLQVTQGPSLSNAIFNKIFEQYANGASVAAAWNETISSGSFTATTLTDERP